MKPSEKIKICPECHSSKIKKDWNLMGTVYKCEECGYKGVLILEISKEKIEKLNRKDLNNRKNIGNEVIVMACCGCGSKKKKK